MLFTAELPPLTVDALGVWRVGQTPVAFEILIARYLQGDTAEQIAEGFPIVPLADIHSAISYYLRHREECNSYLQLRQREDDEIERQVRAEFPNEDLKRRVSEHRAMSSSNR